MTSTTVVGESNNETTTTILAEAGSQVNANDTMIMFQPPASAVCDESKCVSMGRNNNYADILFRRHLQKRGEQNRNRNNRNGGRRGRGGSASFDCYAQGPGTLDPFSCADGFEGRLVESVEPIIVNSSSANNNGEIYYYYYTCCPPEKYFIETNNTNTTIRRHCLDPIKLRENDGGGRKNKNRRNQTNTNTTTSVNCDDDIFRYPRMMTHPSRSIFSEHYVCCDSELTGNETSSINSSNGSSSYIMAQQGVVEINNNRSFLDEVDCVPYFCGDDHNDCISQNMFGILEPMVCLDEVFRFPRKDLTLPPLTRFSCCKIEEWNDGPFVQSSSYWTTVGLGLAAASIGLVCSLLLISSLSISFWQQNHQKARSNNHTNNDNNNNNPASGAAEYCSYNLYLVLLAIPDSIFNSALLAIYGWTIALNDSHSTWNYRSSSVIGTRIINTQNHIPGADLGDSILLMTTCANLYMNSVVAFEIFLLLKNSHKRRRTPPPTIRRATIQAIIVYAFSAIMGISLFFSKLKSHVSIPVFFLLTVGIPVLFLAGISGIIWYRGFIPSMGGRTKVIALYYLRIVLVFFFIFMPGVIVYCMAFTGRREGRFFAIGLYVCSLQAVASLSMAMTKADVRTSVLNILCCCKPWRNSNRSKEQQQAQTQMGDDQPSVFTRMTTFFSTLHSSLLFRRSSMTGREPSFSISHAGLERPAIVEANNMGRISSGTGKDTEVQGDDEEDGVKSDIIPRKDDDQLPQTDCDRPVAACS